MDGGGWGRKEQCPIVAPPPWPQTEGRARRLERSRIFTPFFLNEERVEEEGGRGVVDVRRGERKSGAKGGDRWT